MPLDIETMTFTYKWTEYDEIRDFGNKLPFNFKCPVCGSRRLIVDKTKNIPIACSNIRCLVKLVIV